MTEIMFFAGIREQMGQDSLPWNETPITVAELKKELENKYKLANLEQFMLAVNEEFAENNTVINDGDTVAIIQPVSGG